MKDDVTELIVNALIGKCQKCKGRGWIMERTHSRGFSDDIIHTLDITTNQCDSCLGTGEA